jgi:hypothetical protein
MADRLLAIDLVHIDGKEIRGIVGVLLRRVKGMLLEICGFANAFQLVRLLWTLLEWTLGLGSGHGTNPTRDHHLLVLFYKVLDSLDPRLILLLSGRLIRSLVNERPR